jgi:antitoxin HigA-1
MENIVNGMRPIHPGEILREEFLIPLDISAHALSMAIQVPAPRINEIVRERRAVTVNTALRLSKVPALIFGWACKPITTWP